MIEIKNAKDCCGCEACANICPKQCISMQLEDGFYYPKIDEKVCINCNLCEKVCPVIKHSPMDTSIKMGVAGYIKDNQARFNSTSGGMAYLLCKGIVDNNGVAYGVSFDSRYNSVFSSARTRDELKEHQGSKYAQSKVGDTYKKVKENLENGERVIFVGTPCQVFGLSNYLGKTYDNLILVDLICHAVASPEVWQGYIANMFPGEQINKVVFKYKDVGWKKWNVHIETDKRVYSKERGNDTFMSSYLCGYNVRPACFSCEFKEENRRSDITIADGWGVPEEDKELNDGKGLSSIIINTEKGKTIFDLVKNELEYKEFSVDELIKGNVAYSKPIVQNVFRRKYLKDLKKKDVLKTLNKYAISSVRGKMYMKISNYINRFMEK